MIIYRSIKRIDKPSQRIKKNHLKINLTASKISMNNDLFERIEFLNRVQLGAPVNFHLKTMFSNFKIAGLDFLSLYDECMSSTGTSAPSWKTFRRAQRALILGQYFDYSLSVQGRKAECGVSAGSLRYLQIKSPRLATKAGR